ncbi:MAG: PorP/SprF family type IX secretion system membrane protein [Bacteroidetes bacterium]|nr:PorP/SprF family type IX secretion system membrane protein [Bacteroidota bacterium]MCB0841730.1 PorP/SprF family type IX secretion system membrane protein [Bacteroidota bacterium]MCB0854311.1 PorP/SprF family type IX secretion system membrane protein [Bacteroidota bacterium]
MRIFALTTVLTLIVSLSATAQVYFQNTMYAFNRFVYNPAAAGMAQIGMENGVNLTLLGRQQWLGIEGAPRLSTLFVNSPVSSLGGGIGASLVVDQLGPLTSTGLDVSYAYYLINNEESGLRLSIGVSGGFRQKALNGNWVYDTSNGEDPTLVNGNASTIVPSLGAGIYLTDAQGRFFVGLSGLDLLEPSLENLLASNIGEESNVDRSFYLIGGYKFNLNFGLENEMSITPTIMAKTDGIFPPQVDANVYWNYSPVTFGLGYRFFNDSFSGMLGVNVNDRTFLGYSYDYTMNALNASGDISTHEIIISYTFPSSSGVPPRDVDILDNPNKL